MFDLKVIHSVLGQMEEERGIPKEKIKEAIEAALATAYKKEYGKKGQIIRADFNMDSGSVDFSQVKIVVDENSVILESEEAHPTEKSESDEEDEEKKPIFNPEHHIFIEDARKIKKGAELEDEIIFPLELKDDFGRIASQTAKQVIIQKIREAEKDSVLSEFGEREGDIVSGTVQRVERGNIYVDMGRATGLIPYDEQIHGERYRTGERIRAYLYQVDETPRGVFLKLSRSAPEFLQKLFEVEAPEIGAGTVEIKSVAREAGSRTKIAVKTNDEQVDPVGAMVGGRGVRVSMVMSELGGEKIDIIEWSDDPKEFIEDSLSPAKVVSVEITNEEEKEAKVTVAEDQQSLAIGKGGQNVRLAAKLTGWKIDIESIGKPEGEEQTEEQTKEELEPEQKTEEESSDNSQEETREEVKKEEE